MLPPGVLHMSALGCFGRFTLFSPRVSHSNTCRLLSFVCFVFLFGFFVFVVFWFLFCKCLGIPNSPRSLDLDDRQGLIARSAMQQKKKEEIFHWVHSMPDEVCQAQRHPYRCAVDRHVSSASGYCFSSSDQHHIRGCQ